MLGLRWSLKLITFRGHLRCLLLTNARVWRRSLRKVTEMQPSSNATLPAHCTMWNFEGPGLTCTALCTTAFLFAANHWQLLAKKRYDVELDSSFQQAEWRGPDVHGAETYCTSEAPWWDASITSRTSSASKPRATILSHRRQRTGSVGVIICMFCPLFFGKVIGLAVCCCSVL